MLCPNCETENNDSARLCVECGFPLKGAVARGAGAASPSRMSSSYQRIQQGSILAENAPYDAHAEPSGTSRSAFDSTSIAHQDNARSSEPNRSSFDYAREAHDFSWDVPVDDENPARSLFEPTSTPQKEQRPHRLAQQAPPQPTHAYEAEASQTIAIGDLSDDLVACDYAPHESRRESHERALTPEATQAPYYPVDSFEAKPYGQESLEPEAFDPAPYHPEQRQPSPYPDQGGYAQQDYEGYSRARLDVHAASDFSNQQTRDMSGLDRSGELIIEEEYYEEVYDDPFDEPYDEAYDESYGKAYEDEGTYLADTIDFDQQPYSRSSTGPLQSFSADEKPSAVASRGRNFRIAQKKKGLKGGQKALLIGGIVVIVAAIIAVVGFALGFWGGVAIPNVVGMTQENAEQTLRDVGFEPSSQSVPSDDIEGRVIGTEPKVGTLVEEGSHVTVQIAMARTIPQVVGLTQDEAQQLFDESGYTNVKVVYERSNDEEGIVLSVTPAAGTRAKSGMEITLAVSQSYTVPDVAGMSMDEAYKAVQDAGLAPTVMYADTDQYPDGSVIGSDPAAGTKVREGSYVAITVARKRGVELTNLAREYLSSGNTVTINDVSYQVESIDALSYQGNETVSFTVQAKPFVEIFGETLFASTLQTVTGSIVYNENNEVIGIY